jgi:2,5-diamino-6-(ribosylamino)-4(3H)-pyrimidinone 5'-phosphate reductase
VSIVHGIGDLRAESRFVSDGHARVILFTGARVQPAALTGAQQLGVELYACPAAGPVDTADSVGTAEAECATDARHRGSSADERVDLGAALERLGALGIERLLVEGGGSLNFELLQLGLVDELQVYLAPLVFGGASAPTLADGAGLRRPLAIRLVRTDLTPYPDGGMLLRYKVEQS